MENLTIVAPATSRPGINFVTGGIPSSTKYEKPSYCWISSANIVPAVDARRHRRIDMAHTVGERRGWETCLDEFIEAAEIQDVTELNALRPAIRDRFFEDCPHKDLVGTLRKKTGKFLRPAQEPALTSVQPTTHKGPPAAEIARKRNRAEKERERRSSLKGKAGQSANPKGKKK
jgi:hypothetical protein